MAVFCGKHRSAILGFEIAVDQIGGAQEVGDEAVDRLIVELDG